MWETIGIWLGGFLTLFIFSFLYKDNPFYKFAEHLYVGISAGYWAAMEWHNVFLPNLWRPLTEQVKLLLLGKSLTQQRNLLLVVPFFFGILLFSRFTKKFSWLSRWPMALIIGMYAGIAIIGYGSGDLILQIHANLLPLWTDNWFTSLNNILLTVGVITGLIYFFFSKEHKGTLGGAAKIGTWFLMISFGASFGYTVMSRMSLLIGRIYFLLANWLHILH
jgi:MFS family permease